MIKFVQRSNTPPLDPGWIVQYEFEDHSYRLLGAVDLMGGKFEFFPMSSVSFTSDDLEEIAEFCQERTLERLRV